jgi:hypothetical protein
LKNIEQESISRLEFYRELYEEALYAIAPLHDCLDKNMRQYLGSDEIDGSGERACTVRNITYELIESQISADVPLAKVDIPCFSEQRESNAITVERLCSSVRDRLPFEAMNDRDERYTYIYGASVWYVEWDNGSEGVSVHCLSPKSFIPQPGICDVRDMEYCFLRFTTTRGEMMRKYGISAVDSIKASCEYEYDNSFNSDAVSIVICFYRDADGEIGRLIFSGELILSDTPKYYRRKEIICKSCGLPKELCRCEKPSLFVKDISLESYVSSDGQSESVPYYIPKEFPIVIRRNIRSDDGLFGSSDCQVIRPQQQAINKVESRILQKLLRSGITPIMPEDSTVTLSNAVFGQVIKMRAGESANNYSTIDTTPDISSDVKEADRLYDQAKRVLGISDALQGTDSVATESGYARELKIAQSSSRLESKRRLKYLAYSELYRLIFNHYLAFSDRPRPLSFKDPTGKVNPSVFNRHSFIEIDGYGNAYYSDDYLFSVDLNGGGEYQRESLWEKNLTNLESGTLGDKTLPSTLLRYWQAQERACYPYARENVEYFKNLVNESNTERIKNEQ